jgi:DNA-binding HxlR family transcriptional regulator
MEKRQFLDNPLGCPVVSTLSLISGKWKPMIIHALIDRSMRFGEIKKNMLPISQKVLTEQLRELESVHIIHRQIFNEKVVNVTYSLTNYGKSLGPVLEALYMWGENNIPYSATSLS